MNHILAKGVSMLRKIFGVPHGESAAAGMATRLQSQAEQPRYRPASKLTAAQIDGDVSNGDVWIPWRVDADSEEWFERVSQNGIEQPAAIMGIAPGDDLPADDDDGLDDVRTDAQRMLRREVAIIKSRNARGEGRDSEDDDDEFEDADDEV
ncbi:MAG: hypothetical protein SH850_01765 [Planctomycetaceae bacterium]|nr:hypothetical protein [Planctomycetaceae bacterium]